MSRRRAVALGALGATVAAVALLAAMLGWLLYTQSGLEWATGMARRALPQGVEFDRVQGRLAGPLTVQGLSVDTAGNRVEVERVALDWRPLALLRSRVRVSELDVSGVDIALAPAPAGGSAGSGGPPAMPALPSEVSLPLGVVVDRLAVERLTLQLPDGRVERMDRFSARATLGPDGVALRGVDLRAPLADLDGDIHVGGGHPFTVRGGLDWTVRPPRPDIPPMAGRLDLDGTLEDLRLQLQWRAPASASVTMRARVFGERPRWSAAIGLPATALRQWWREAPELALGAELELAGSFERATARGKVDLRGLPTGPLRAQLDLAGTAEALQIEQLRLAFEGHPDLRLDAKGRLELGASSPALQASVQWRALRWPLEGTAQVTSPSGQVTIDGSLERYTLAGEAALRTPQTGDEPVRVELAAQGTPDALSEIDLRAAWHEARLQADGRLQWRPRGSARFGFDLQRLDPGRIAPELAGRLGLRGEVASSWGETLTVDLGIESLAGELHGQPVSGSARARYRPDGIRVERLTLAAGDARVQAAGTLDQTFAFDWDVAIPRLQALVPEWAGRIEASGRVTGPTGKPRVTVRASAAQVALPWLELASVEIDGAVAPFGGAETTLDVRAAGIASGTERIQSLTLQAGGTPERHRLDLRLQGDRGAAELAVTGSGTPEAWSGRLERATLAPARLGRWLLVDTAPIAWREGRLDSGPACWRQDGARLCVTAGGGPADWRAELDARSVPVALPARLARDDLEYQGTFGLQARVTGGSDPVTGTARVELSPGTVHGTVEGERETLLDYGAGRLVASLGRDGVELEAALPLTGDGVVRVEGRFGRTEPRTLDARLQARVADLGLVAIFVPQVGRVDGRLLADIELKGTLAQPTAAGDVRLDDGRVELVALGIDLTGIRADLSTADDAFDIRLAARSGDGEIEARARVQRMPDRAWRGSGTLTGDAFRAVNLPEAEVVVSPALDWQFEGRSVDVSGRVVVPLARIEPRDLSGTVQTTPDAVIVGARRQEEAAPAATLRADVEVVLGPEVRLDAFGLEGRLEGAIRIRETPGQLTSATGELRVAQGSYTFYRQQLEIERGRVIYDGGPASNPGLDVRAVRRPRNVVVGANVRGTLREPRIELFSEPPMEESQQLSYLILGVPLRETSGGDQSALAAAAAALARSKQGGQIAGLVGIQEVEVESSVDGEGASIVLGRYLSPRLYVGYGIGLMEQANSVRMRYDLTEHWQIDARSGINSSADLLYSIEVDSNLEAIPDLPLFESAPDPSEPGRR